MNYRMVTNIIYNKKIISRLLSVYSENIVCQRVYPNDLGLLSASIKINIRPEAVLFFQLPGNFVGRIHKDINLDDQLNSFSCALNLPLHNCKDVLMKWHTPTHDSIEGVFSGPSYMDSTPMLDTGATIDAIVLDKPHTVRVDDWHSVVNQNQSAASFISVRFSKDMTHQDIIKELHI